MNTLAQYLPVMREAPGRIYFPGHAVVGVALAVVLLVSAGYLAVRYPANKAKEAIVLLGEYGNRTAGTVKGATAALERTQDLLASQPEWFIQSLLRQVEDLQRQLSEIPSATVPTPAQVLDQARQRQADYDKAQQLIATSPFKDLPDDQVPLTDEGKQLLEAREVKPADRFEYQQLMTGAVEQLAALRAALKVQASAETLAHRIDVQINGDQAAPLGNVAAGFNAAPQADANEEDDPAAIKAKIFKLMTQGRELERRRRQEPTRTPAPLPASGPTSTPMSVAPADRNLIAGDSLEAVQAKRRAERQAAAAERQTKARRDTERAESETRRQVAEQRAAEQAQRDAERLAQQEAAQRAQEAETAAKAMAVECTSSIPARILCAKNGYSPLTGKKRRK